jgi:3-oxoacyl-[acyl-carrier protein] reductase
METRDRAAIITGGGTGIGAATALRLADGGCSVLVNYSRSREAAERIAEQARTRGVKAIAYRADVTEDAACRAMVKEAVKEFGGLDILINNAGTTTFIDHDDLEGVADEDWDRILAVNLKGPFHCTRAARPAMESRGGGEVVMISSVAGIRGFGSSIPYCASKGALNNMTVTLARVLGKSNIRVNAVAPGFIHGDWLKQGLGDAYEVVKQINEQKTALGRVCDPDDVAQAIVAVITGSDQLTGQVIPVDAGMTITW